MGDSDEEEKLKKEQVLKNMILASVIYLLVMMLLTLWLKRYINMRFWPMLRRMLIPGINIRYMIAAWYRTEGICSWGTFLCDKCCCADEDEAAGQTPSINQCRAEFMYA